MFTHVSCKCVCTVCQLSDLKCRFGKLTLLRWNICQMIIRMIMIIIFAKTRDTIKTGGVLWHTTKTLQSTHMSEVCNTDPSLIHLLNTSVVWESWFVYKWLLNYLKIETTTLSSTTTFWYNARVKRPVRCHTCWDKHYLVRRDGQPFHKYVKKKDLANCIKDVNHRWNETATDLKDVLSRVERGWTWRSELWIWRAASHILESIQSRHSACSEGETGYLQRGGRPAPHCLHTPHPAKLYTGWLQRPTETRTPNASAPTE